jgi:hypothetical protein
MHERTQYLLKTQVYCIATWFQRYQWFRVIWKLIAWGVRRAVSKEVGWKWELGRWGCGCTLCSSRTKPASLEPSRDKLRTKIQPPLGVMSLTILHGHIQCWMENYSLRSHITWYTCQTKCKKNHFSIFFSYRKNNRFYEVNQMFRKL